MLKKVIGGGVVVLLLLVAGFTYLRISQQGIFVNSHKIVQSVKSTSVKKTVKQAKNSPQGKIPQKVKATPAPTSSSGTAVQQPPSNSSAPNSGSGSSYAPPPVVPPAPTPAPTPAGPATSGTLPTLVISLSNCGGANSITLSNSQTSSSVDCTITNQAADMYLSSAAWGDNDLAISWNCVYQGGIASGTGFSDSESGVYREIDSAPGSIGGNSPPTGEEITFSYSWN